MPGLVSSIDDLLAGLDEFQVKEHLLPAENLSVCAQQTATRLIAEMEAIGANAPGAEQSRRERLSRVLNTASEMDRRLTEGLTQLVSVRQKQIRLYTAAQKLPVSNAMP